MAEPVSSFYPESPLLTMQELVLHIDSLTQHIEIALDNSTLTQQPVFLQEFSQNVLALHKLVSSLALRDVLSSQLKEAIQILTDILLLSFANTTLIAAVKDASTLSAFLHVLEKYPESARVLVQELKLVSYELKTQ